MQEIQEEWKKLEVPSCTGIIFWLSICLFEECIYICVFEVPVFSEIMFRLSSTKSAWCPVWSLALFTRSPPFPVLARQSSKYLQIQNTNTTWKTKDKSTWTFKAYNIRMKTSLLPLIYKIEWNTNVVSLEIHLKLQWKNNGNPVDISMKWQRKF